MASDDTKPRAVFFISDGTGITAETIGRSILTQFDGLELSAYRIPFVKGVDEAWRAVERINEAQTATGARPIVITTVMDMALKDIIAQSDALILDAFAPFIAPLEQELSSPRQRHIGRAHGMADLARYEARMAATNYAMAHDDGATTDYSQSEVVLVGVSRVGKTPTCLYMALHFGIKAANYPLIPEDLEKRALPDRLDAVRERIFGLTIDPLRLHQVRQARRPNSEYAALAQCRWEVQAAERIFQRAQIPCTSTTHTSVEELSSRVLAHLGIDRRLL